MSGDSEVVCKIILAPPPACDSTYAEELGAQFDAAQALYDITYILVVFVLSIMSIRIVRTRKVMPLDTQKKIFFFCDLALFAMLLRAIDPFGWRDIVPLALILLSYDVATAAMISLISVLVHDWALLVLRLTGRRELTPRVTIFFRFFYALVWVSWPILGILQGAEGKFWLWRAIKLGLGAVQMTSLVLFHSYFGLLIYHVLKENEKTRSGGAAVDSGAIGDESTEGDAAAGREKRSGSRWGRLKKKMSRKKKSKITKILKLMVATTIVELLAIVFQLSIVSSMLADKPTLENPPDPPEGAFDILNEAVFDIVQFLAISIAAWFFRPRRANAMDGEDSRGGASSGGSAVSPGGQSTDSNTGTHAREESVQSGVSEDEDLL